MSALVLIPARYASSRFPGKPLCLLNSRPMIQYVYERLNKSKDLDVYVVTDDQRIEEAVLAFGGRCLRVDDGLNTGSERIYLAYKRNFQDKDYRVIINVQGDEPLVQVEDIEKLYQSHFKNSWDLGTLYREEKSLDEFENRNKVKLVIGEDEKGPHALYFSRSPIPFDRDSISSCWNLHVGVYSYSPQVLEKFCSLPMSSLEKREKLEQLRALESGTKIHLVETKSKYIGVDSPEDIKVVEGVLKSET